MTISEIAKNHNGRKFKRSCESSYWWRFKNGCLHIDERIYNSADLKLFTDDSWAFEPPKVATFTFADAIRRAAKGHTFKLYRLGWNGGRVTDVTVCGDGSVAFEYIMPDASDFYHSDWAIKY